MWVAQVVLFFFFGGLARFPLFHPLGARALFAVYPFAVYAFAVYAFAANAFAVTAC